MKRILRKTHRRLILWSVADLLATVLAVGGGTLFLSVLVREVSIPSPYDRVGLYVWWVFCLLVLSWRLLSLGVALFYSRGILDRLERTHPEYCNELSTLVYLDRHPQEVEHLGFSPDLIQALREEVDRLPPPDWARLGLSATARKGVLGVGAAGGLIVLAFLGLDPGLTRELIRTQFFGPNQVVEASPQTLKLPERVEVPYRQEMVFSATGEIEYLSLDLSGLEPQQQVDLLVKQGESGWKSAGTLVSANGEEVSPIRLTVDRETRICFSIDSVLGSVCTLVPVYPPAVETVEVGIDSPPYANRPRRVVKDRSEIEALASSGVEIVWTAKGPVTAATLEILSPTRMVESARPVQVLSPREIRYRTQLAETVQVRLALEDRFGQKGFSKLLQLVTVPDSAPEVEILSPTREVVLPTDLRVPIRFAARDDIGLASLVLVYQIDNGMPAGTRPNSRILAEGLNGTVGSSTPYLG